MKLLRMALLASVLAVPVVSAAGRKAARPSQRGFAGSPARNVVERIEVSSEPTAVVVTIVTRAPPTFTTRTLPTRRTFLVDLPETRFERLVPVTSIGDGVIARLESTAVLREHVPVARIAVVLSRDTEPPEVEAIGSKLRIRIPGTPQLPPRPVQAPEPVAAVVVPQPEHLPEPAHPERARSAQSKDERDAVAAAPELPSKPVQAPGPVAAVVVPQPEHLPESAHPERARSAQSKDERDLAVAAAPEPPSTPVQAPEPVAAVVVPQPEPRPSFDKLGANGAADAKVAASTPALLPEPAQAQSRDAPKVLSEPAHSELARSAQSKDGREALAIAAAPEPPSTPVQAPEPVAAVVVTQPEPRPSFDKLGTSGAADVKVAASAPALLPDPAQAQSRDAPKVLSEPAHPERARSAQSKDERGLAVAAAPEPPSTPVQATEPVAAVVVPQPESRPSFDKLRTNGNADTRAAAPVPEPRPSIDKLRTNGAADTRAAAPEPEPRPSFDKLGTNGLLAPAAEPKRLVRDVAFRMLGGSSAVVVRLSGPPRFEVRELDERRIAVDLPHATMVRKNDARPLDTSFFPGAVSRVEPRRVGAGTRIEIILKQAATHRERVDGDTLIIELDPAAVR